MLPRLYLLLEKIRKANGPSLKELKSHLHQNGFEVSDRTVQRDIENLRINYGIEIDYNRNVDGYNLNEAESQNVDAFLRFLEIVQTADILTQSLKDAKDSLRYLSFENQGQHGGVEHLKSFLFAIQHHRYCVFTHHNFLTDKVRRQQLRPYLLKEYQNRWYVVGQIPGINEFRTFGVGRISDLEIQEKMFKPVSINPNDLFAHTVGLTYSTTKVEEVILSFTPLQGQYVKSLPLHASQEVVFEDENELRISLHIHPNFEFVQRVLMFGDSVTVIKPDWFKDKIQEQLKNALNNYSK